MSKHKHKHRKGKPRVEKESTPFSDLFAEFELVLEDNSFSDSEKVSQASELLRRMMKTRNI